MDYPNLYRTIYQRVLAACRRIIGIYTYSLVAASSQTWTSSASNFCAASSIDAAISLMISYHRTQLFVVS
ncbi:hypothetical protein [Nostoc sp.]|uniref:hypothetical protein n=1 Tax=Nostoc sp. TaxID=1180 RepID=UPI002FFD0B30